MHMSYWYLPSVSVRQSIPTILTYRCSEYASAGRTFPSALDACLTARCTGFLSAVAVSCSRSASDLIRLGLQTVVIAFRVGACAWDVGSLLCGSSDAARPFPHWTIALAGLGEEDILKAVAHFVTDNVCFYKP